MRWVSICKLHEIPPRSGVAALVHGEQVAVFRIESDELYAVGNTDPFSGGNVMARSQVENRQGQLQITSPGAHRHFSLTTGYCLDDPAVRLLIYPVRVANGMVQVGAQPK